MLPHSHAIIFNRFKTTHRDVVWFNLGGDRAKIFVDKDDNALSQLSCHTLKQIEVIQNQAFSLDDLYSLKLSNGDRVLARLDEAAFFAEFYINEEVYSAAGQEVCLSLDVALGTSDCEPVVEGVYSVAKVHKMSGGQGNESLMQRAGVYHILWHVPTP